MTGPVGLSVLVAEDDRDLRNELGCNLTEVGFSVVLAANSEEAIACLVAGLQPAVVLTDLFMPNGGGAELIQFLLEDGRFGQVALICMTGNRASVLAEALAETGVRLLAKPFDFAQLMLNISISTNIAALADFC